MTSGEPSILLVDDDVDICANLADILIDLGYRVDAAHDGATALGLIEKNRYDVAVLDYRMPGMNGVMLTREIRRVRPDTVSLLVSAYAGAAGEEAISAGAWQVLAKPVDTPKLLKLVVQALGQPLVLVVDDDEELCSSLWDLLRDRDFRVGLAHNTRDAGDRLSEARFDVVVLDVRLPDGDASNVFREVCSTHPETRTVLITGDGEGAGEIIQDILKQGAEGVYYKPFDLPRFLETLARLTQKRSMGAAELTPDG